MRLDIGITEKVTKQEGTAGIVILATDPYIDFHVNISAS